MSERDANQLAADARDALAAVETLYQAAKVRLVKGHADTCTLMLCEPTPDWTPECDCGQDALAAAVRLVEDE